MYKITRSEWDKICKEHPEYVCKNFGRYCRNGLVSEKGAWSCFEQLLSHNPKHLTNVIYENVDFEIIEEKAAYKTVTTYHDDGKVDMVATKIMAGEYSHVYGWSSEATQNGDVYVDLFPDQRGYRAFRRECHREFKNNFSCKECF